MPRKTQFYFLLFKLLYISLFLNFPIKKEISSKFFFFFLHHSSRVKLREMYVRNVWKDRWTFFPSNIFLKRSFGKRNYVPSNVK